MKSLRNNIILLFILCLGFVLRSQFINWDQGFHLHPDERMLLIVADRLHFWDHLNPEFFSYGSLPIYILKGLSQGLDYFFHTTFNTYDGMLTVGRYLSVFFDTMTIFVVYKIAKLIFRKIIPSVPPIANAEHHAIPLFAAFFYTIAFFPIQNSHFFVVDVFLTFFITLCLYILLKYILNPQLKTIIMLSFIFSCALTTKITAIVFAPFILVVVIVALVIFYKSQKIFTIWSLLKAITKHSLFFVLCTLLGTILFMPYAWLDYRAMLLDVSHQAKMRQDAYLFPYTLQYVGTIPYWYYLKNIFLWGIGPIIGTLSMIGLIKFLFQWVSHHKLPIIFLCFYVFYFLLIGNSAVKFMRYMLPMYPFFAIMAGIGIVNIGYRISDSRLRNGFRGIIIGLSIVWLSLFLNIYSTPHTRIQANDWILRNIPIQSNILVEHWDDRLPLTNSEQYVIDDLTLYDQPDNNLKWLTLNQKLLKADYIIIASNRLYVPLQRLTDCTKYRVCYPLTAEYYSRLFNNQPLNTEFGPIQFKKIKEFTAYPEMILFNREFKIIDDSADESFTVYDHPKIMIFKKY